MHFTHCKLLYWSYEKHLFPDVPAHVHNYFQIEYCVNGAIRFTSGQQKMHLKAGEYMVIPPGTSHAISYEGKDLEYYSFKFEVENLPEKASSQLILQRSCLLNTWISESLVHLRPPDQYLNMPINENRVILEALLLNMLKQALTPFSADNNRPQLLCDLAGLVAAHGAQVNVKSAAESMNINIPQLKYRYKLLQEDQQSIKNVSLKRFIDSELIKIIDRLLFYSDLSLSEIAAQTRFNNIYTFSRFVARMTGLPPSARRNMKK